MDIKGKNSEAQWYHIDLQDLSTRVFNTKVGEQTECRTFTEATYKEMVAQK